MSQKLEACVGSECILALVVRLPPSVVPIAFDCMRSAEQRVLHAAATAMSTFGGAQKLPVGFLVGIFVRSRGNVLLVVFAFPAYFRGARAKCKSVIFQALSELFWCWRRV